MRLQRPCTAWDIPGAEGNTVTDDGKKQSGHQRLLTSGDRAARDPYPAFVTPYSAGRLSHAESRYCFPSRVYVAVTRKVPTTGF